MTFFKRPLPECSVDHLCGTRQLSKQVHPPDTTLAQQPQHQLWIRPNESPSSSSFPLGREASAAAPPSCCRGQQHPQASWQQVPPRERHANHEGEFVCSAQAHNVFIRNEASFQPEVLTGPEPTSHSTDHQSVVKTRPRCVHHTALNYITLGQQRHSLVWMDKNSAHTKLEQV